MSRRISNFCTIPTKYQRNTSAIFIVKVHDNIFTHFIPEIEISIDLSGIYGKDGYPTPGEGSFLELLKEGVWSRQLKVQAGSKTEETKAVGNLFIFCKCLNAEKIRVPPRWGADIILQVRDFNDIFKDALKPNISRYTRIFKLLDKLLSKNCHYNVKIKNIEFIGYQ